MMVKMDAIENIQVVFFCIIPESLQDAILPITRSFYQKESYQKSELKKIHFAISILNCLNDSLGKQIIFEILLGYF